MVQDLLSMARLGIADSTVSNLNQIVHTYLQSPEFRRLQEEHPHVRIEARLQEQSRQRATVLSAAAKKQ